MKLLNIFFSLLIMIPLSIINTGSAKADLPSNAETIFDWAEDAYPQFFPPQSTSTLFIDPWYYRYYPATDVYTGVNTTNEVWVLGDVFGGLVYINTVDAILSTIPSTSTGSHRIKRMIYDLENNGTTDGIREFIYNDQGYLTSENYTYVGDSDVDTDFISFFIDAPSYDSSSNISYDTSNHVVLITSISETGSSESAYEYGIDDLLDQYTEKTFDVNGELKTDLKYGVIYSDSLLVRWEMFLDGSLSQYNDLSYDNSGLGTSNLHNTVGLLEYTYNESGYISRIRNTVPTLSDLEIYSVDFEYDAEAHLISRITQGSDLNYRWDYTYSDDGLQQSWKIDLSSDGSIEAAVTIEWEEGSCEEAFYWVPLAEPNFLLNEDYPYAPGSGFIKNNECKS